MASANGASEQADAPKAFVYNAWYIAAWADEVTDTILGRTLLNIPIAFYRRENGEIAALVDICPHKYAPLSLGKRIGDVIQCGYHGLEFNHEGRCIRNPQGSKRIPPGAEVRTFALVERHGAIWIWMGHKAQADEALIPDFSFFSDPGRKAIYGRAHVQGNYQLSIDNLMDLGHGMYLHRATTGDFGEPRCEIEVGQEGSRVWDRRLFPALPVTAGHARRYDLTEGELKDISADIEWLPAGCIQNQIFISPVGKARLEGRNSRGVHCLTPETESSTHYFFANVRNYLLDSPVIDEQFRRWQKDALQDEDSAMVSAIEHNMAAVQRLGIRPIYLDSDNAGARVRRVIESLIAAESRTA